MDQFEQAILEEVDKQLQSFANKIFQYSQEYLIEQGKVDTGILHKTANINRGFLEAEIVYPALYADFVHNGRAVGSMPPVKPIQAWVKRKLGVTNEAENKRVAFAIAMAIKQRGILPCPYLQQAVVRASGEYGV